MDPLSNFRFSERNQLASKSQMERDSFVCETTSKDDINMKFLLTLLLAIVAVALGANDVEKQRGLWLGPYAWSSDASSCVYKGKSCHTTADCCNGGSGTVCVKKRGRGQICAKCTGYRKSCSSSAQCCRGLSCKPQFQNGNKLKCL